MNICPTCGNLANPYGNRLYWVFDPRTLTWEYLTTAQILARSSPSQVAFAHPLYGQCMVYTGPGTISEGSPQEDPSDDQ